MVLVQIIMDFPFKLLSVKFDCFSWTSTAAAAACEICSRIIRQM